MKKETIEVITENEVLENVTENSVIVKELEGVSIDDFIRCSTDGTLGSYSREMVEHVKVHTNSITSALKDISKNYEIIIFNLYWVYRTNSYKALGCDSIFDYALLWFDFRKSTVYKFIDIAERFGNEEYTAFDSRYKGYSISKLSLISDKSDSEISSMPISPNMSVREIKKIIKSYGAAFGFDSSISDNDNSVSEPKQQKSRPDSQEAFTIDNNEVSLSETSSESDSLKTNNSEIDTSVVAASSESVSTLDTTENNRFFSSFREFYEYFSRTSYTYMILNNFIFNHYKPDVDIPFGELDFVFKNGNYDVVCSVSYVQGVLQFSSNSCSPFYVTEKCINEFYVYAHYNIDISAYTGKKKLEPDFEFDKFWINSILTDLLTALGFKCDKITFKIQNNND